MSKFKAGDRVVVTSTYPERKMHGRELTVDSVSIGEPFPYGCITSEEGQLWFSEDELALLPAADIDPQELADFLAQYNNHSDDLVAEVAKRFNLPDPTRSKKTMTVVLKIDVSDRDGEFRELGDTYGAFKSLMIEYGFDVDILNDLTDENITVEIKEENA